MSGGAEAGRGAVADRVVEFRSYKLKPGSGVRFHQLVLNESLPLLRRAGVEVVAYGPSLDDPDGYFLARAYDSLEQMRQSEEAFYSADAWRKGPREAILELIESYTSVVFRLSREAVEAVRASNKAP